jgi:hypothetical protein
MRKMGFDLGELGDLGGGRGKSSAMELWFLRYHVPTDF